MASDDQRVELSVDDAARWLGLPRLQRYRRAAGRGLDEALALYEWNSRVAAAALLDVGHFEVALRNAYDAELVAEFPDWASDRASRLFRRSVGPAKDRVLQDELNRRSLARLDSARSGLGASPSHGRVLAALDLGFWAQLTRRERTATLWTPYLSSVFPPAVTRGQIHELVDILRKFRNRLAHNEPVFSSRTGLNDRLRNLRTAFGYVHPDAEAWVRQRSAVLSLLADCPVPGLLAPPPPPR